MQRRGGPASQGSEDYDRSFPPQMRDYRPPPPRSWEPYDYPPSPPPPPPPPPQHWRRSPPPPPPPPPPRPPHPSEVDGFPPRPPFREQARRDPPPWGYKDRYGSSPRCPPWESDYGYPPRRQHYESPKDRNPPPRSFAEDDFGPPPPPPPPPPQMRNSGMRGRPERGVRPTRGAPRGRGGNQARETFSGRGRGRGRGRGTNTSRGMSNAVAASGGTGTDSAHVPSTESSASSAVQSTAGSTGTVDSNGAISYSTARSKRKRDAQQVQVTAVVPGQANFISYKNSLQECCQKKQLPVPSYVTFKKEYGRCAKVSVAGNTFISAGIHVTDKLAEQAAAYAALISLQLMDSSIKFDAKTAVVSSKRPAPAAIDNSMVDQEGKRIKLDSKTGTMAYKSQLNEFCQKFHLPTPVYETTSAKHGKGFTCSLVFNKKMFTTNSTQASKKQAEQHVAQLVLSTLNQCPPPAPSFEDYIEQCKQLSSQPIESADSSASTTDTTITAALTIGPAQPSVVPAVKCPEVTSYKNKLQEYCQKSKHPIPVYSSTRENGVFSCSVEVVGKTYSSTGCNTKKGSEQSAAHVALKALGIL